MATPHSSGLSRLRTAALLAASVLVASAATVAIAPAQGVVPPTPTGISAAASTYDARLGGAVPDVLVQAGDPIDLTVTLQPAGAAFKADTTLSLTPLLPPEVKSNGSLSPTSIVMPAGVNSTTFDVSYSATVNGLRITVEVSSSKGKPSDVAAGTTAAFDVLKVLKTFTQAQAPDPNGLAVGNADCGQATNEPACGILFLPNGSLSDVALSLGACTADDAVVLRCQSGSQVVQVIADLVGNPGDSDDLYRENDPALLIYRCDKKLCAGKGIKNYTLNLSFDATGALNETATPCVGKGVAHGVDGKNFCIDYVQSHRDNSGDALLYLLFTHDMRAST